MAFLFEEFEEVEKDIDYRSIEAADRAKLVLSMMLPNGTASKLTRFGNDHDGGYVCIDDLTNNDHLISCGLAYDVTFESALSGLVHGIDAYDYSVDGLPADIPNSRFFKEKIVGATAIDGTTVSQAISRAPLDKDLVLKIDIEGWEWEVFSSIKVEDMKKFRQIVVELHWLDRILNNDAYTKIYTSLARLTKTHSVVNFHINNYSSAKLVGGYMLPEVVELTLARKADYSFTKYSDHNLNAPNNPKRAEIYLPYTKDSLH